MKSVFPSSGWGEYMELADVGDKAMDLVSEVWPFPYRL